MKVSYISNSEVEHISDYIKIATENPDCKALGVVIAENTFIDFEYLSRLLADTNVPVFGGVFPELIYNNKRFSEGILITEINFNVTAALIDLTTESVDDYLTQIANIKDVKSFKHKTIFVFLDAFNANKSIFLNALYDFFGTTVKYIGGGAGRLSFKQEPCVLLNSEIHINKALIVLSEKEQSIGVAHGWEPISEPVKVSKAEKNTVYELNWKPAFEVYKNIVENHSGKKFTADNFFDIAKSYPLGISKLDSEIIVRDPLFEKDNALVIVDEVPQGEFVQVLNGNKDSLLKSAQRASQTAVNSHDNSGNTLNMFCIDCISRVLYLQNDFESEIQQISNGKELHGILTIGEVANSGDGYLDIFNKTVVVIV